MWEPRLLDFEKKKNNSEFHLALVKSSKQTLTTFCEITCCSLMMATKLSKSVGVALHMFRKATKASSLLSRYTIRSKKSVKTATLSSLGDDSPSENAKFH